MFLCVFPRFKQHCTVLGEFVLALDQFVYSECVFDVEARDARGRARNADDLAHAPRRRPNWRPMLSQKNGRAYQN